MSAKHCTVCGLSRIPGDGAMTCSGHCVAAPARERAPETAEARERRIERENYEYEKHPEIEDYDA